MNLIAWIIASMGITVPLLFSPASSELFEFPKLLLIYLYAALLAPIVAYQWYRYRNDLISPRAVGTVLGALGLFFVTQVLATIFSIDRHMSLFGYYSRFNGGLLSLIAYLILFTSTYLLVKKQHLLLILKGVVIGGGLIMLWGLPSKFGHDFICSLASGSFSVSCWTADFNPTVRLFSTVGQPNWLAAYLLVIALTILFFITTGKNILNNKYKQYEKYILSFLFILACVEILWTGSRSGIIALLITTGIYIGGLQLKRLPIPWIPLMALIIPLIGLLNVSVFAADTTMQTVTPSSQIRLIVWKGALALIKQHPLTGTGLETFAIAYNFTRPQEHNLTSEWNYVYNKAHNEFLNMAATSGLLGLAAYLGLLTALIGISAWTFWRAKGTASLLGLLVATTVIGLTFSNFFGFSTTTTQLFLYLYPALLLGYIAPHSLGPLKFSTLKFAVYLFIVVVCGNYILDYAIADYSFAQSKLYSTQDDLARAYSETANALSHRTEPVYLDQQAYFSSQLALYYTSVNNTSERDRYAQQAITLNAQTIAGSPYNLVYWRTKGKINYVLSIVYAKSKNKNAYYLSQASSAFEKAQELAPTDPKNYLSHALIVAETNPEKARKLLQTALKLKPNYEEARTYLQQL